IQKTQLKNIEQIRERAINNIYFQFDQLEKDFHKLFLHTILNRCRTIQSINYMLSLINDFYILVQRKQIKTKLTLVKNQDLERLFKTELDKKYQVQSWPFIPQFHRKYQGIYNYFPEPEKDNEQIQNILLSEKKNTICSDNCACMSLETLGDFSLENATWNSECPNRKERMECLHHECKNAQGRLKLQKIIDQDVQETLCWGIDLYTKKNLHYILHENECDIKKHNFIQRSLLKAANLCGNNGWDMQKVCEFIIQNSKKKDEENNKDYIFNNQDRKFSKVILKTLKINVDPEAFRIHSKGMGVICLNRQGIEKNDLIIQYFGEIYRPYRWFERQDFVKKFMKENNQKDVLPDFYNIMLEIHKNDPKGYDILVKKQKKQQNNIKKYVDPMQKGNYSSRLSHSCDPNCGTVATISDGKYNISMYAMKSIEYGEELAFDYSAVTESKQEHMQATCLCGTYKCRGKYIEFSNNNLKEYNFILEKMHCFLKRNSDLLRCSNEILNSEDLKLLEKHNMRKNITENCPSWLMKWISIILKTIDEEKSLFLEHQMNTNIFLLHSQKELRDLEEKNEEEDQSLQIKKEEKIKEIQKHVQFINYLANSKVENRIQNLVISIDKVKYFLKKVNDFQAPLDYLNFDQIFENLCGKNKESILDEIYDLITSYKNQCGQILVYFNIFRKSFLPKYASISKKQGLLAFRLFCLNISEFFKKIQSNFHSSATFITLYFYSFTHTYFTPHEYASVCSEKMKISETEMQNLHLLDTEKKKKKHYEEQRIYSPQFIWGQLTVWFKQTIASPQATLSQDRRGTLSFPSINQSFKTDCFNFPFQEKNDV
ncbi:SET domain protein, partial [Ichthyophthirius multifiliis]